MKKLLSILIVSAALAFLIVELSKPKRRVTIEWAPTPGAVAYRVVYGPAGATQVTKVNSNARAVLYLPRGRTNYIRVIAILTNGVESAPSTNLIISP